MSTAAANQLVESLRGNLQLQAHLSTMDAGPMASTDPQMALDLKWLIDQMPVLLPAIITIFTGGAGFPIAIVPILIQIISQLFNVSNDEARAMITA